MTNSDYIDMVAEFLKHQGVEVELFADLPSDVAGRIDYQRNWIGIDSPTASDALVTICHEAGHYMSHIRRKDIELNYTRLQREQFAYLYGWAVICHLNIPITKEAWRAEEMENLKLYTNK